MIKKIILNEEEYITSSRNLYELILELKLNPSLILLNKNNETISNFENIINENDKIDIYLLADGG